MRKTAKKLLQSMLRSLIRLGLFLFLASIGPMSLLAYGWFEPDSAPGYLTFQALYHCLGEKQGLNAYRERLLRVNDGCVPAAVDQYLISRLRLSSRRSEQYALTDFYVQQAGGNEGKRIHFYGHLLRPLLAARLPDYSPAQRASASKLLVSLHREESIHQHIASLLE